jgi:hypothetical protein
LKKSVEALVPHTVLVTLLVVLVLAEIIARTPWVSDLPPPLTAEQLYVEAGLERSPSPQVIFMGNSRIRVGVSPQVIGEILRLPSSEVSNIAFDTGKPRGFVQVYTEHRAKLQGAEMLFVGVDAKMFNQTLALEEESVSIPGESASTLTRLWSSRRAERVEFVVSRYWKTWEKRATVGGYLNHLLRVELLGRGEPYIDDLGRVMLGRQRDTYPSDDDFSNRQDFKDFIFDEEELKALHDLVLLAREDDTAVVLVDAPLGPVYRTMVETQFPDEDSYWRHRIWETTGLTVEMLPLTSSTCADWKRCFVDEGHLNYSGARGYSEDVGQWLKVRFPSLSRGGHTAYPGSEADPTNN